MQRLSWGRRYLLVEPRHFDVTYRINPWMRPGVDTARASAQWSSLVRTLLRLGADIELGHDQPGLPDMSFAMNAGFVYDRIAVPSRFRHPERQLEEPHWHQMLCRAGRKVVSLCAESTVRFEAGDAFVVGDTLVGGWGFRSDRDGVAALAEMLGLRLLSLQLVDPRFYHLDTCFCPLGEGHALAYLDAVDPADDRSLRDLIPGLIPIDEAEATTFVANSLVVGDTFVTAAWPPRIARELAQLGLDVTTVDVSQFHLSGGSVRCLTLPLDIVSPQEFPK